MGRRPLLDRDASPFHLQQGLRRRTAGCSRLTFLTSVQAPVSCTRTEAPWDSKSHSLLQPTQPSHFAMYVTLPLQELVDNGLWHNFFKASHSCPALRRVPCSGSCTTSQTSQAFRLRPRFEGSWHTISCAPAMEGPSHRSHFKRPFPKRLLFELRFQLLQPRKAHLPRGTRCRTSDPQDLLREGRALGALQGLQEFPMAGPGRYDIYNNI